jgi:hypothetical protein
MNCLHIIFSKDRALQLKTQLDSIKKFVSGPVKHVVLYTCSEHHEQSYQDLLDQYADEFTFVKQTDFRTNVQSLVAQSELPYVFFTPDDGVFIRDLDLSFLTAELVRDYIFSLRLGTHLTECHPAGKKAQTLPDLKEEEGDVLTFSWDGEYDWSYPLALDGHIFDSKLLLTYTAMVDFRTPTSFEVGLQRFIPINFKKGMCFSQSSFVSLPWNVVTNEMNNLSAGISNEVFLEKYNDGKRIKVDHIYETLPISCHQEYDLEFI